MASGKTHTWVAFGVIAATQVYSSVWGVTGEQETLARLAGSVVGLLITPDIDHHVVTVEERRITWLVGVPVGKLWQWFWTPYRLLVGKHRGLAHWPILGTLSRVAYLFLATFWIPSVFPSAAWLADVPTEAWYQFVLFWIIQDLFHLLFDI